MWYKKGTARFDAYVYHAENNRGMIIFTRISNIQIVPQCMTPSHCCLGEEELKI